MRLCVIFGIFFVLVAAFIFYKFYRQVENGLSSPRWPYTRGIIILSRVESSSSSEGRRSYSPVIQYAYKVSGMQRIGKNLRFIQDGVGRRWSEAKVSKYPVGREVKVFYKSDNPAISVLEPGAEIKWIIALSGAMLLFGIIFLLLSYACYWDYRRVKNANFDGKLYYI
jgi:hypothetical protein